MDISHCLLGKSLDQLTYQDIADFFIEERHESNNIEFKAFSTAYGNFNENIKGIIRAICGLLNSEGGVVIWGAPMGVSDPTTKEKKFRGALSPVSTFKEKDWIINKVSDNISPLPVDIKVTVLQQSTTEILYVFEVKASQYKPHQFENIYFIRLDGQTKPAPHYLIEALFRQISFPLIEGFIKLTLVEQRKRTPGADYTIWFDVLIYNFSELQNEENVVCRIQATSGLIYPYHGGDGSRVFSHKIELLHFGTPHIIRLKLVTDKIHDHYLETPIGLVLTFGGKSSPAKVCEYTIQLKSYDATDPVKVSQMIESLRLNLLFSEHQQDLGINREVILKKTLGDQFTR